MSKSSAKSVSPIVAPVAVMSIEDQIKEMQAKLALLNTAKETQVKEAEEKRAKAVAECAKLMAQFMGPVIEGQSEVDRLVWAIRPLKHLDVTRRAVITPEKKTEAEKLFKSGTTAKEVAEKLGCSLPTAQNLKKELGLVNARA